MMSGMVHDLAIEDRQSAKRAAQKIKEQKLAKQVYVTSIHQARRK